MYLFEQKQKFVDDFNLKWAGKELYFCPSIYNEINFAYSNIRACCMCTMSPYTPPIFYMDENNNYDALDLKTYFRHLNRIMTWNQTSKSVCSGCKYLKKMEVPPFPIEGNIKLLSITNFTICNSNCVYCNISNKTGDNSYALLPLFERFLNYKLINSDTLVNWGGGEPIICSEFDKCTKFFIDNKIPQNINSSGIKFSEFILDGMKNNILTLQISPDAGTAETYSLIKRQNGFDKVWNNISKYAEYPDKLKVKYIIFSLNSNENEINKFIEKCVSANVKNIVIDVEHNSSNGENSIFGKIGQKEIDMAVLLKKLAINNSIDYSISHQWSIENKKLIEDA